MVRIPGPMEDAFDCPHCGAYAQHLRVSAIAADDIRHPEVGDPLHRPVRDWWFLFCHCCGNMSVWFRDRLIYPDVGGGRPPNPDLPEDIRKDYLEAQTIVGRSPRGAAALLRLCIQNLCKHLGEKGKNINDDIASLVKQGLRPTVQQALDAVRVIGNEAVHPGEMDLKDDRQTAEMLFKLVNVVAQEMISVPKEVEEVFDTLPKSKRDQIARRDGRDRSGS